ncbi:hypothetical protein MJO29_014859 [Puccinia striiformis f. sp. tritici]|nr:hypothetical protein MJO29_014859 [Puccinia striiformis f. sp. tritici]
MAYTTTLSPKTNHQPSSTLSVTPPLAPQTKKCRIDWYWKLIKMPTKKSEKPGGSSKIVADKTLVWYEDVIALAKQQASQVGQNKEAMSKDKAQMDKEKEKEHECKQREELNELFKPVQVAQKVCIIHLCSFKRKKLTFDTDPKSVLCQYFKNL